MSRRKIGDVDRNQELLTFLRLLEHKLNAPVLNGGFDALFQKVEKIENSVEKLNEAVFDPETGLFVRVKTEKLENDHEVKDIENRVNKLDDQLKMYRKFIIGLLSAGIVGFIKFAWDYVSSHITFH